MYKQIILLLMSVIGLVACTPAQTALPLAEDQPTFLFFYTDN
ncbi:MAG: hypothetical protein ACFE0Q_14800 [Anaerolineae bacterium]